MKWLLEQGEAKLHGFMLPGHVCTVTGYEDYEQFPVPQVVAGFEPEDILLGLLMLIPQVREGTYRIDNAYPRAVCREGNVRAKKMMYKVFEPFDVEWRGFPVIPGSGLRLKTEFRPTMPRKSLASSSNISRSTRPASVTRCSGVLPSPPTADSSEKCAARGPRSGPAWSAMKVPARSGTCTRKNNRSKSPLFSGMLTEIVLVGFQEPIHIFSRTISSKK